MKTNLKSNKKYYFLWIIGIILIIIAVGILFINFFNQKNIEDSPPSLNDSGHNPVIVDNSLIGKSTDLAGTLTKISLIGNWKVIQEEVNGVNSENINENLIFNSDGSYSLSDSSSGISQTKGYYQVNNNRIYFYNSKEDIGKQGSFDEAFGKIESNKLTLVYPGFPKVVVYQKEN